MEADLLIDSGAAVTLVSSTLFNKIPHKDILTRNQCNNIVLKTADEGELRVEASVTLGFEIDGTIYTWNAFVAPIPDDVLIGYDFLYNFNCILEARRGLIIDGHFVNSKIHLSCEPQT